MAITMSSKKVRTEQDAVSLLIDTHLTVLHLSENANGNLTGRFTTIKGQYEFRAIVPTSYPVPIDGPGGDILALMGREAIRPAHIHFLIRANGYKQCVTQIFPSNDKHIDSDPVFGVKASLIKDFSKQSGSDHVEIEFDFYLTPITRDTHNNISLDEPST
jgi:protocatechuate 3,4-dioxygenase beta subunit